MPETTSTSCCEERYSSDSSSLGSDRTTSSSSRPGTTAAPSRSVCAGAETRMPSSMSVAWSSTRPSPARTSTPESVWIALRVETPRAATPRLVTNSSHEIENFMYRSCLEEVGAVDVCDSAGDLRCCERRRGCRRSVCKLLILSAAAVVTGASPSSRRRMSTTVSRFSPGLSTSSLTRFQACRTVVWLRPPNSRPSAGRPSSVSSRARYMATWRAKATFGVRSRARSASRAEAELPRRSPPGSARPSTAARPGACGTAARGPAWRARGWAACRRARRRRRRGSARPRAPARWRRPAARRPRASRPGSRRARRGARACAGSRAATAASGAASSATRPHSKRSLSRASKASRSVGLRSLVITSWRPDSYSALKVWKSSSFVRTLSARNWTSSRSSTSTSRKRSRKRVGVAAADGLDELRRELLDGRVADAQAVAVALDVVADRVQQVRLAEPGRAVDEERVLGLGGQLRDGQRGRVGEPVAVADHELLEGVLRVEAVRPPARRRERGSAGRRRARSSRRRRARRR